MLMTSVFVIVLKACTIERQLQQNLKEIENWATYNGFKFSKCQLRNQHYGLVLHLNGSRIPVLEESKEALAIRRVISLVDMITNTKFSNCTLVFKIGVVRQQNMQRKH